MARESTRTGEQAVLASAVRLAGGSGATAATGPASPALIAGIVIGWLACVVAGFWIHHARPLLAGPDWRDDPRLGAELEQWFAPLQRSLPGVRAGYAVFLPSTRCACLPLPARAPAAIAAHGVTLVNAGANRIPHAPGMFDVPGPAIALDPGSRTELLLFSDDGRLRYAGPATSAMLCLPGRSLAELMAASLSALNPPNPAPFLHEACPCPDPSMR